MEHITIRAFRAVDEKASCAGYLREHIRVLEDIGVTSVVRPDLSWCLDPTVIVIVAEHDVLGIVAGVRLHRAAHGRRLPLELLLRGTEPQVREKLEEAAPFGLFEIAGLWCAHRFSGNGLPVLLSHAGVSLAGAMGGSSLLCFAAQYTATYIIDAGGAALPAFGINGDIVFPTPKIRSTVLLIHDLLTLTTAHPEARQRVLSLRIRPSQTRTECPKNRVLQVRYDLAVDQRAMSEWGPASSYAA